MIARHRPGRPTTAIVLAALAIPTATGGDPNALVPDPAHAADTTTVTYGLSVDPAERDALAVMLATCQEGTR